MKKCLECNTVIDKKTIESATVDKKVFLFLLICEVLELDLDQYYVQDYVAKGPNRQRIKFEVQSRLVPVKKPTLCFLSKCLASTGISDLKKYL